MYVYVYAHSIMQYMHAMRLYIKMIQWKPFSLIRRKVRRRRRRRKTWKGHHIHTSLFLIQFYRCASCISNKISIKSYPTNSAAPKGSPFLSMWVFFYSHCEMNDDHNDNDNWIQPNTMQRHLQRYNSNNRNIGACRITIVYKYTTYSYLVQWSEGSS